MINIKKYLELKQFIQWHKTNAQSKKMIKMEGYNGDINMVYHCPHQYNAINTKDSTLSCSLNILNVLLCMQYRGDMFSIFPTNSEAFASELLENLEEMSPCH